MDQPVREAVEERSEADLQDMVWYLSVLSCCGEYVYYFDYRFVLF